MLTRLNKVHPALKHAGYSATTLLPGEDPAAFEKLHRALIERSRCRGIEVVAAMGVPAASSSMAGALGMNRPVRSAQR
jgi:hypothetical protein